MNRPSNVLQFGVLSVIVALAGNYCEAATTGAAASAFVSGTSVTQSITAGAEGAVASAAQVIPSPAGDVFVTAAAMSKPGVLRAAGVARSSGSSGGFQAQASASWADSFVISAPGYDSAMTGTFSGAVHVSGELLVEFVGRVYSDSQIYATLDIFPGTGYNGGRTVVNGSARNLVGYDIIGRRLGTENFSLVFLNVPFTFNQRIDVNLGLTIFADLNVINAGSTGRSAADYSNTMSWSGLSSVKNQDGSQLSAYSALSASSNFNFANPTPVPEPSRALLLALGMVVVAKFARYCASA